MIRHLACAAVAFCITIGAGVPSAAQTGQISGEVLDPSGATVSKASVRVINQSTLVERHSQTNDVGRYTFPFLPPGAYQAVVEAAGFSTVISEKLTLTVGQALVFNVQLAVGQQLEHVVVQAQSQAIDTTDAQVSNVIDQRQIESLPLLLRDPYQLALLSAGVNATNNGDGGFSVNGGRESSNSFLLDGADNTDVEFQTGPIAGLNPDSTQEFRVITNNFMPEYGRSDGAVIDVVTKSGSNNWHGTAREFGRWAVIGARDYFNDADTKKNPYTRNIFGASVGGPIVKDKTFFFFDYEGSRFATTRTIPFTVPTKAFLSGNFTYTENASGTPVSVPVDVSSPNSPDNFLQLPLDPIMQKVFSFFPTPAVLLNNGIQGEVFAPEADDASGDGYTVKLDHTFSLVENLSLRYQVSSGADGNVAYLQAIPGLGGFAISDRNQALSVQLASAFNSGWVNKLVLGGHRTNEPAHCTGLNTLNGVGAQDVFGDTTDLLMPAGLASWGCVNFGDSDGQTRASGEYSVSDQVTRIAGRHTPKFGGQFSDLYSNNSLGFFSRPFVSFGNFLAFGIQQPSVETGNSPADSDEVLQDMVWALFGEGTFQEQNQFFTPQGTRLRTDELNMRARDFSFFGQDSYKVLPNLTLNYGILWEFNCVPYDAGNRLATLPAAELSGTGPITFQNVGANGVYLYKRQWLVPQPRVGFAWDPFKNGKTSIRGAVGIFRDRAFFEVADNTRGNPPFSNLGTNTLFNPFVAPTGIPISALSPPPTLTPSTTVQNLSLFSPSVVDQNLRLPYTTNWNLGVQRALGPDIQLELNYIGVAGRHLLRTVDGNQPLPSLVQKLRSICQSQDPSINTTGCVDGPNQSDVAGINLYEGFEFGILPFDAVNNNAIFHASLFKGAGDSIYNALQATVTKRFSRGIYIQGAYTWAHEIDDSGFPFSPQANNSTFPTNSFNVRADRSNGSFDIRQSFVMNYVWELPFGRKKPYFNRGLAGKALEGWSLAGITAFQGGAPYDILTQRDAIGNGGDPNRPDYNPNATPLPVLNPRTQTGPNVGLFSEPPFGRPGNLGRNVFRVPGTNNWDVVLAKTASLSDRFRLEFRTECYNLFNRVQFAAPSSLVGGNVIEFPSLFGQSLSEVGRPDGTSGARQLQLGVKLKF